MDIYLELDDFPSFCGGRVITEFPYDADFAGSSVCTAKANVRNRVGKPCDNCDLDEDDRGEYFTPTSYCHKAGGLEKELDSAIAKQESEARAAQAGVVFAAVNREQLKAFEALRLRKWNLLHEFVNPNSGNRVYVLSKMLV